MTSVGDALRNRRVRLGLTVDVVASATGLPAAYVREIEEDRPRRSAPTPAYDQAWRRTYERFLARAEAKVSRGLSWDAASPTPPASEGSGGTHTVLPPGRAAAETYANPDPGDPVPVNTRPVPARDRPLRLSYRRVRVLAAVSVGTAFALLLVWAVELSRRWQVMPEPEPPPVDVGLRVLRPGPLVVQVDGRTVLDRKVERGARFRWRAEEAIAVDVQSTLAVDVTFDGHTVSPRGHRDRPRRMVFLAEGDAP